MSSNQSFPKLVGNFLVTYLDCNLARFGCFSGTRSQALRECMMAAKRFFFLIIENSVDDHFNVNRSPASMNTHYVPYMPTTDIAVAFKNTI